MWISQNPIITDNAREENDAQWEETRRTSSCNRGPLQSITHPGRARQKQKSENLRSTMGE